MKHLLLLTSFCIAISLLSCDKSSADSSAAGNGSQQSANGSLTRFITVGNYLYIVDRSELKTFNITNPAAPVLSETVNVGFNIATIFHYQEKLFIGSNNNMYIYSISNPAKPVYVSDVLYFQPGKDPIVALDTVAYSTVRNGNFGTLNVVNIKNIANANIVGQLGVAEPYGLAAKDSVLYVASGSNGITIYNIRNRFSPVVKGLKQYDETFYDFIMQGDMLICYIKGGIILLDISNRFNPTVIARIKN